MNSRVREVIIVRSLTDSDLGLFAVHRPAARSKQRALNINAPAAQRLLSKAAYKSGGVTLDCQICFGAVRQRSSRDFGKSHKNWRLGGKKIQGLEFSSIDSADFALLRSPERNNGTKPVTLTFVSRAADRASHKALSGSLASHIKQSMAVAVSGDAVFADVASFAVAPLATDTPDGEFGEGAARKSSDDLPPEAARLPKLRRPLTPMPSDKTSAKPRDKTIHEKLQSPNILEKMLKVSGDLSAPAQHQFMDTVEQLASQLRKVLLATNGIITIERNHRALWSAVAGHPIGFVDGGLANLSSLGSAPIACRVGGYIVTPGDYGPDREKFTTLKLLISELFVNADGGVYDGGFPDIGALRDAARISIEAAGAVHLLQENPNAAWVFLHGALVNPVSRYTDIMHQERVTHRFPNFSASALKELLPADEKRRGKDANFISVHLRQLQLLQASKAIVCGVVERESTTTIVAKALISSLDDEAIRDMLPLPPAEWKHWFRTSIDPRDEDEGEAQRITDSLLFRCVLEPGEALAPVEIDRNEERRRPRAWRDVIGEYPRPLVSYLQPTEWNSPVRLEFFSKDKSRFPEIASLVMHCSMLLPQYAFPAGLDIVDKFARIPNWMSTPINTNTAVLALKRALDRGDDRLFDTLRRILCGSSREWLLRPGIMR